MGRKRFIGISAAAVAACMLAVPAFQMDARAAAASVPEPPILMLPANPDDSLDALIDTFAEEGTPDEGTLALTGWTRPVLDAGLLAEPTGMTLGTAALTLSMDTLVNKSLVKANPYYNEVGYSSNHYSYTAAEVTMLAIVIHMEARSEPYSCQIAVGNVVMNRVLSPGYPGSTIKDVVTRPNQFCYNPNVKPSKSCIDAATAVLKYETWVVPQNTYFFKASSSTANWGKHQFYARLGHTAFYRDSYSGRYNGASVPAKLFDRVYKWPQLGCKPAKRVRAMQTMLKSFGYKVVADGYFGQATKDALVQYQKKQRLTADGVAGPATLKAMIRKYGLAKYQKLIS